MFVIVFMFVAVVVLVVAQEVMRRRSSRWRLLSKFPGDFPLPVIGNALQLGFNADRNIPNQIYVFNVLLTISRKYVFCSETFSLFSKKSLPAFLLDRYLLDLHFVKYFKKNIALK